MLTPPGIAVRQDAAANLTISSPLEAHKPRAIIHSIVGVDVGFENPMFAALEVDYTESDQDPTGAAFEAAEKVRLASRSCLRSHEVCFADTASKMRRC